MLGKKIGKELAIPGFQGTYDFVVLCDGFRPPIVPLVGNVSDTKKPRVMLSMGFNQNLVSTCGNDPLMDPLIELEIG